MNSVETYFASADLAHRIVGKDDTPDQDQRRESLTRAIQKAIEDWLETDRLPSTAHFFPAQEEL